LAMLVSITEFSKCWTTKNGNHSEHTKDTDGSAGQ
jgi:hypothetical protein